MMVSLRVTEGPHAGSIYRFDRHVTLTVGRSSQAGFSVPNDGFLSRHHFLIEFNPPACLLKDLGSTNGTKVNEERVDTVQLRDGDRITAGESAFVVQVDRTMTPFMSSLRCLACGRPAPEDISIAAGPEDSVIEWVCSTCSAHRDRFPKAPEGYWIEAPVGGGGMGQVFRARHLATNRFYAIKTMTPQVAASERAKAYFRRELEVLKNLVHPNIVAYHGMFETGGQFQLIMEYVDGPNALEWIKKLKSALSVQAAARIGIQLLAALAHAHAKGDVHRDIKPSNLIVTGQETQPDMKLTDFGLAKSFRDDAGFGGLTHMGDVGGSGGFISPDHIRDFRDVKEPADIYGVGATLYFMLCKDYPFLDFNPHRGDAYTIILEHPPLPLRARRPDIPEGFDRVLCRALEKQPRDRWKSAESMAEALKPYLKPQSR